MKGSHLRFYTYENRRVGGQLVFEWLLEQAKRLDIHGGSAFRAIAGFGHQGRLHEQRFLELAGEQPVLVEFLVDDREADALLSAVESEGLRLFHARTSAEYGETGEN